MVKIAESCFGNLSGMKLCLSPGLFHIPFLVHSEVTLLYKEIPAPSSGAQPDSEGSSLHLPGEISS